MSETTLYTTKTAADYLRLHVQTVKHHVYKTQTLHPLKTGGRDLLFSVEELDRWNREDRPDHTPKTPPPDAPKRPRGRPRKTK